MAPNNQVQADIAGIASSVTAMNNAGADLNGIQAQINAAVSESEGFWKSAGAKAFRDAMVNQFHQAFTKMVNDLQDIEHRLSAGQQQYNATIDQEASKANSFLSVLNG